MDTIFMKSKNSKNSNPHRLLLNLTDTLDLRKDKYIALSNLRIYYTLENIKSYIRTISLKFQLQHGMKNLDYLMDHILYQIYKIILNICWRSMGKDC